MRNSHKVAILLACGIAVNAGGGCSTQESSQPVMVEPSHQHYHIHASDVEHDHQHQDFQAGGHSHGHQHKKESQNVAEPS